MIPVRENSEVVIIYPDISINHLSGRLAISSPISVNLENLNEVLNHRLISRLKSTVDISIVGWVYTR